MARKQQPKNELDKTVLQYYSCIFLQGLLANSRVLEEFAGKDIVKGSINYAKLFIEEIENVNISGSNNITKQRKQYG